MPFYNVIVEQNVVFQDSMNKKIELIFYPESPSFRSFKSMVEYSRFHFFDSLKCNNKKL